MLNLANKLVRYFSIRLRKGNDVIKLLSKQGIAYSDFDLLDNKRVFLKKIGLELSVDEHLYLIRGYSYLKKLKECANAEFVISNSHVQVNIMGLKLIARTREEIFILHEIFVEGLYNLCTNQPLVFMDIGMNVGYASLFLATKSNVVKIYGYEPFIGTFSDAIENINLNPTYSNKIVPNNFGVGSCSCEQIGIINKEWRGSASIIELSDHARKSGIIETETVQIIDFYQLLTQVLHEANGYDIAIKMDCEGSEYDILEEFCRSDTFDRVKVIMLEWHKRGDSPLLNLLLPLGFKVVSFGSMNTDYGMIYAIR